MRFTHTAAVLALYALAAAAAAAPQDGSLGFTADKTMTAAIAQAGTPFAFDANPWDYDVLSTLLVGYSDPGVDSRVFLRGDGVVPQNGGFESGDLTGWDLSLIPPLLADPQVIGPGFVEPGGAVLEPLEGNYAFYNEWNTSLPSGTLGIGIVFPVLDWMTELRLRYRAYWDLTPPSTASQPRVFHARLDPAPPGGAFEDYPFLSAEPGTTATVEGEGVIDLRPFRGSFVTIDFLWEVPEGGTGPAWFVLDSVRVFLDLARYLDRPDESVGSTLLAPNDAAFVRAAWDRGYFVWDEQSAVDALSPHFAALGGGDPVQGALRLLLAHLHPQAVPPSVYLLPGPGLTTFEGMTLVADPATVTLVDGAPLLPNPRVVTPFNAWNRTGVIHTVDRLLWPIGLP